MITLLFTCVFKFIFISTNDMPVKEGGALTQLSKILISMIQNNYKYAKNKILRFITKTKRIIYK